MNILLKTKQEVETQLGKQLLICPHVLDMVNQGEKAYNLSTGGLNTGFTITVGFFNDKARYVGFKKNAGQAWDEADIRACLMQIGPWANWVSKPGSKYFDYSEKNAANTVVAEATGWETPEHRVAFVYVPVVAQEIGIAPVKASVDHRLA